MLWGRYVRRLYHFWSFFQGDHHAHQHVWRIVAMHGPNTWIILKISISKLVFRLAYIRISTYSNDADFCPPASDYFVCVGPVGILEFRVQLWVG